MLKDLDRLELVGKFKYSIVYEGNRIRRTYHLFRNTKFGDELLVRVSQSVTDNLDKAKFLKQEVFWISGDPLDSLKPEIVGKYKKLKFLIKEIKLRNEIHGEQG